ncbi:hypothetical protein N1851_034427 [Merluccius polli]|uniref:Uncharacterized protein n=1 Tax=Merluccius polli TaxID=89951 RepID=A0AA47LZM5_MERPO|nr:hypothetical protein N1851_034427 [Merluccius polli]
MVERSTAGEAEVEVAPIECIETTGISPDGKAKGEVLAWRELGSSELAKEGQKQAEQIPTGVIKMKQPEQVQIDTGAPVEHIKSQLSKTGIEEAKLPKTEETQAVHIKVEDNIKKKGKDELLRAEKINAEPSKLEKDMFKTKQAQAEKAKVKREEKAKEELNEVVTIGDEQTNAQQAQAVKHVPHPTVPARIEHAKIEHAKAKREPAKTMSEKRMAHSVESLLIRKAEKEKLKQEPDRVEKVKTELAKAKVELAKIKEKMRKEQKEKQSNTSVSKAVDKNVLQKEKQPPPYQQTDETPVRVEVEEYEHVREKYGFNKSALTSNRKPPSANDVTSQSQDIERSPPHSDKGEEASNNNKPRDEKHSQIKAATKDKEKKPSVKDEELRESQYVYSESSKEFKLSNPNDSSSHVAKQMDHEIHIDNTKDKVMNTKPEPVRANIDISQPGVSNMNPSKSLTHERKPNPNKDTHSTPSRTLTHKERTQTKQEILTSKIKAHAEKEISAIKERHFASGKSVQQRLPSQEVTKPLDKNIPNSIAPRDQQATVQMKTSIPNSVATPPVMSSNATTSLLDSQVQKQEPLKSVKDIVIQQQHNDNRNEELKQREKKSGAKVTSQIKVQSPVSLEKEEVLKANSVRQATEDINASQKTKADPPPSKPEESSQHETHQTSDVAMWETKEDEDAPSIKLVFGQNEAPAAADDDSLQIMGIMVTVRARTETPSINDEDGSAKNKATEKAKIDSQTNDNIKPAANLGLETTKENIAPDISNGRAENKKQCVLTSQPTVGIEHTKVGANNHLENEPEESTDRLENKMADLTDKRLTTQKESSLMRKTSHTHTVHQEDYVADKADSSTVMKPALNKPGKTQPILFKHGKITEKAKIYTNKNKNGNEAKSNIKVNVEVGRDPSLAKAMETGFNSQMSSLKSDIKSSKMQNHPPPEKYQMADHVTSTKTDQSKVHIVLHMVEKIVKMMEMCT